MHIAHFNCPTAWKAGNEFEVRGVCAIFKVFSLYACVMNSNRRKREDKENRRGSDKDEDYHRDRRQRRREEEEEREHKKRRRDHQRSDRGRERHDESYERRQQVDSDTSDKDNRQKMSDKRRRRSVSDDDGERRSWRDKRGERKEEKDEDKDGEAGTSSEVTRKKPDPNNPLLSRTGLFMYHDYFPFSFFGPTKSKGVTTQMKALHEYFLMVVFTLLLSRVNFFAIFMFNLVREIWQ